MIKFNLELSLERQGVSISKQIKPVHEITGINRVTISRYLKNELDSIDFTKLSPILDALCDLHPHLDQRKLMADALEWVSFEGVLAESQLTYYLEENARTDDGPLFSGNDSDAVSALQRLHPSKPGTTKRITRDQPIAELEKIRSSDAKAQSRIYIGSPKVSRLAELRIAGLFGVSPFSEHSSEVPIRFTPQTPAKQRVA